MLLLALALQEPSGAVLDGLWGSDERAGLDCKAASPGVEACTPGADVSLLGAPARVQLLFGERGLFAVNFAVAGELSDWSPRFRESLGEPDGDGETLYWLRPEHHVVARPAFGGGVSVGYYAPDRAPAVPRR
jgi:hypothetical protein